MGETPLTEASSRAIMARYADSAALKVGAQLRSEFGGRIDAVESSVGALPTLHTAAVCGHQDGFYEA